MPPKRVPKKLPSEQIPFNCESSSNPHNPIGLEFIVNRDAELKREYKKKISSENQILSDLNVLLDQEEIKSKGKKQDEDLLRFKAQLKQLREKLV